MSIFDNSYYKQFQAVGGGGLNGLGYASVGVDALQSVGQFANAYQQSRPSFNTQAPNSVNFGGQPQYNLGGIVTEAGGFNKKDYGRGMVAQGAGAGLKLGTNPALLAATGGLSAPIGAAAGAIAGVFGQKKARNRAQEMQDERERNIAEAQRRYNEQSQNYTQGYLARQEYEQQFQ